LHEISDINNTTKVRISLLLDRNAFTMCALVEQRLGEYSHFQRNEQSQTTTDTSTIVFTIQMHCISCL